jgi:ubiquinone biosynthesis protein UbiJ
MTPVVAAINHVLAPEDWARKVLALHAGKLALIDTGAVSLRLRVGSDGLVEAGTANDSANVTIRLKLSDLPLMANNRERAFSYVKIEGDAEFANAISKVSGGLRWEAEADLERLIGPIAARRVAGGARDVIAALRDSGRKLSENMAEYFLDEKALLVRPAELNDMASEVIRLRDDVERADKRLAKLVQRIGASPLAVGREQVGKAQVGAAQAATVQVGAEPAPKQQADNQQAGEPATGTQTDKDNSGSAAMTPPIGQQPLDY